MKSDWDDAPAYIRGKKKHSPWRMVAFLGVGSVITWGLIALFAKPIVIDIDQLKQAIRVDGQPLFSQQSGPIDREPIAPVQLPSLPLEPRPQIAQPSIRGVDIEWSERGGAITSSSARNNFNDNNYRPRQPVNTYSPPVIEQRAAAPAAIPRQQPTVSRERTAKWIKGWNGGTNYLAEWISVSNYIDSSSVCANHRRGSIDYRECRKAAKQHFHTQCRAWRVRYDNDRQDHSERMKQRYCSASSSFSPMG